MNKIKILQERAAIIQAVRSFFIEQGFLEVETPVRIPAPAPEAYIEPEQAGGWFLQTSPELCMKRLLAAGCTRIFQICKCFRKNERGALHLPEMSMLEWYRPGTYLDLMADCTDLLNAIRPSGKLTVAGREVRLNTAWSRLPLDEAFRLYSQVSLDQAVAEDRFDEVLVAEVEPHLGHDTPVFLYDYPASMASLARFHPDNPMIAQRFELYIGGVEIANGFSELSDPIEQRRRFQKEQNRIKELGRKPAPIPEPFLKDLNNIPPSAGIALGLDRLVMLMTRTASIDQVVAFTPEEL